MKNDSELLLTLMTSAYLPMGELYEEEDLAEIAHALEMDAGELGRCSLRLSASLSQKLGRQFFDVYLSLAEMDEIRLFAFSESTEKYETAEQALNSFCDILTYNEEIIDETIQKLICLKQMDAETDENADLTGDPLFDDQP